MFHSAERRISGLGFSLSWKILWFLPNHSSERTFDKFNHISLRFLGKQWTLQKLKNRGTKGAIKTQAIMKMEKILFQQKKENGHRKRRWSRVSLAFKQRGQTELCFRLYHFPYMSSLNNSLIWVVSSIVWYEKYHMSQLISLMTEFEFRPKRKGTLFWPTCISK